MKKTGMTIYIEVPAHIWAFFYTKCNAQINVGRNNKVGMLVLRCLEPASFSYRPTKKENQKHYLELIIPERYTRKRQQIKPDYLPEIKSLFKVIFKDDFKKEVEESRIKYGLTATHAIERFRSKYGILEDYLTFDASYRAYTRHKEKSNELI